MRFCSCKQRSDKRQLYKRTAPKGAQIRETAGFDRTFSAHTAQKNPEIHQVFPDFSILSGRKFSRSKLLCTQKVRFLCRARRKAQEYWICIPSIFNDVRREKILFALPYPYSVRPKGLSVCFARGRLFGAASFCPAALLRSGTAVLYNSRIRAPGGLSPPGKRTKQREAAPCILWRQRAF